MNAFLRFNQGLLRMPAHWQAWVFLLMAGNLLAPLAFIAQREAQITVGGFLICGVLMTAITSRTGFSRLLGLGHAPWIGLIAYLALRLDAVPTNDAFGIWLRAVLILNALSLVLDTADVIRFLQGNRKETIPNTPC
jgi:hypothetical protein